MSQPHRPIGATDILKLSTFGLACIREASTFAGVFCAVSHTSTLVTQARSDRYMFFVDTTTVCDIHGLTCLRYARFHTALREMQPSYFCTISYA